MHRKIRCDGECEVFAKNFRTKQGKVFLSFVYYFVNCLFIFFEFSYPQFDNVKAQFDGSGIKGKKNLEQWR